MPRIAILSDTLASQVAAGEVVERPSSVLKELIENALDAGASYIEVEIRKGGIALIKVTDNGNGMDKENALLSLERHATSKLSTSEGLASIMTHGFRGEALPSISSVARFRLTTNDDPSSPASDIQIEGGKIISVAEGARAQGTTMEVKDLFFNVPARRKFLKSEATEYAHIEHAIKLSALGNCEVRYVFKSNGKKVWDLKPTKDRRSRISELAGHQTSEQLLNVTEYHLGNITVSGYILPGRLSRGSGKSQTVFINQRPVDDPVIRGAIREGYHGHIQPGQFPVVWLWIQMPPDRLDVNVHPAKKEVRFINPSEVKHAVSEAIGETLSAKPRAAVSPPDFLLNTPVPETPKPLVESVVKGSETETFTQSTAVTEAATPEAFKAADQWATPDQQELVTPVSNNKELRADLPQEVPFNFIGYLREKYWLMEDDKGLVVLDPKAAKSRITYEALKRSYEENSLGAQSLLIPLLLELDGHDQNIVKGHLSVFHELGLEMSHFGGNTFQVLSLPTLLDITESGDAENFILGVIDTLDRSTISAQSSAKTRAIEELIIRISEESVKYTPVKVPYEEEFIKSLMECDIPYCNPSGKPTMIYYAESEIKKKFG